MKLRIAVCLFGSLLLAVGCGFAWAVLFPSQPANNAFFGGMLIPLAWVGMMLWLWFSSWRQLWQRLIGSATVLFAAVYWGARFG